MPRKDRVRKTTSRKITPPSKLGSVKREDYYKLENIRGREAKSMMTTFGRPKPEAKPKTRSYNKPKAKKPRKK